MEGFYMSFMQRHQDLSARGAAERAPQDDYAAIITDCSGFEEREEW
jgi:hypothetical protein